MADHSPIQYASLRGRLILQTGSSLTNNEHGLDILTRPYKARTEEVYQLCPKYGDKDAVHPTLQVTDYQVTEGAGLMSDLLVTYKGLLNDKIPDVVVKGGWAESTASLTTSSKTPTLSGAGQVVGFTFGDTGRNYSDSDEDAEVSVTYRRPTTTFLYITRRKPVGPIFKGRMLKGVLTFGIVDIGPASAKGNVLYYRVVRTVSYTVEKVGAYWQCTETNQGFLISRKAYKYNKGIDLEIGTSFGAHSIR